MTRSAASLYAGARVIDPVLRPRELRWRGSPVLGRCGGRMRGRHVSPGHRGPVRIFTPRLLHCHTHWHLCTKRKASRSSVSLVHTHTCLPENYLICRFIYDNGHTLTALSYSLRGLHMKRKKLVPYHAAAHFCNMPSIEDIIHRASDVWFSVRRSFA